MRLASSSRLDESVQVPEGAEARREHRFAARLAWSHRQRHLKDERSARAIPQRDAPPVALGKCVAEDLVGLIDDLDPDRDGLIEAIELDALTDAQARAPPRLP
jgi:hypothetical protein